MKKVGKKKIEEILHLYLDDQKTIGEIALLVGLQIPIVIKVLKDNISE